MQLPDYESAGVLVVGDLMLDRYWSGDTSRISPEAPVPVVHISGSEERAGGAGNVALNIASLKAKACVLGFTGADDAADRLSSMLEQAGVAPVFERLENRATVTKLRVLSRHQQLIRIDFEDGFQAIDGSQMLRRFEEELRNFGAVVLSDYGKGTLDNAQRFIGLAKSAGKPVLVDPKGSDFSIYRQATLITPNQREFEAVVGYCADEGEILEKGWALIIELDLQALLVTRGEQGMILINRDSNALRLPAQAREVFDVTGAGDTVISTLAAGLAAGSSLADATRMANLAAGIVVGKLGTGTVTPGELRFALRGKRAQNHGVVSADEVLEVLESARFQGERIVATNGCFDILHPGHVHYLRQARALGDRLVVLVNSDDSVRRLKGAGRPVNRLEHRMEMLAALEDVDWVTSFDTDTPRDMICRLRPDILVKGGDYQDVKEIAGYDCVTANGGEVKLLDFVDEYSTSALIHAIQQLN